MPAMATFDDSAGYAEPLPVAHRHPGALLLSRCDVHLTSFQIVCTTLSPGWCSRLSTLEWT
jgi:hypothetical protein